MDLRPGERLDDLGRGGLRIIQHPGRFPFSMDAVLLAHFATVKRTDRVLDLGTGCGVVPLLLAARHPSVRLVGVELLPETADMAARSVAFNRLEARIRIDCGDYRTAPKTYGHGSFDLVTMNPPYWQAARGRQSPAPGRAQARHELAGSLSEAVDAAASVVKYGGRVAMVFQAERLADLLLAMRQVGLEPKRLRLVHARANAPARLSLLQAVKAGGVGLTVEAPLVIYETDSEYTAEVRAIYDGP